MFNTLDIETKSKYLYKLYLPVPAVSQTTVTQVSYGGSGGSLYATPPALKTESFTTTIYTTNKSILTKATSTKPIIRKTQKKLVKKILKKKIAVKKVVKKPTIKTKKKNI